MIARMASRRLACRWPRAHRASGEPPGVAAIEPGAKETPAHQPPAWTQPVPQGHLRCSGRTGSCTAGNWLVALQPARDCVRQLSAAQLVPKRRFAGHRGDVEGYNGTVRHHDGEPGLRPSVPGPSLRGWRDGRRSYGNAWRSTSIINLIRQVTRGSSAGEHRGRDQVKSSDDATAILHMFD